MSQYLLPCVCGANIPVSRSQAGMTLPCPQCGNTLDVPTIRGMSTLAVAPVPDSNKIRQKQPLWLGLLATLSLLVFVGSTFYAGVLLWQRYSITTSMAKQNLDLDRTEDDFLKDMKSYALESSPADTWDRWNLIVEQGLMRPNLPEFFRVKRYLESMWPNTITSSVTAVVSLLLFLGLAFAMQRSRKPGAIR